MKKLFIICAFFMAACQNKNTDTPKEKEIKDSLTSTNISNPNFTDLPIVRIPIYTGDTFDYEQKVYNQIVEKHPEFFNEFTESPDISYHKFYDNELFGSEVGADTYYALYAYFLMKKNGIEAQQELRKTLFNIYGLVNNVFAKMKKGGSYFGHQQMRIPAYVEYDIYTFLNSEDIQKYAVVQQKKLYSESLKQLIADETNFSKELSQSQKTDQIKELNMLVDQIDKEITNLFILRKTQEFQFTHYGYY